MSNSQVDPMEENNQLLDPSQFMLTMLLEDMIDATEPPDFSVRILKRLDSEASCEVLESNSLVRERMLSPQAQDEAVKCAAEEIENGYGLVIPPPLVVLSKSIPIESDLEKWIRRGVVTVAALAAALVGALVIPSWFAQRTAPSPSRSDSLATDSTDDNAKLRGIEADESAVAIQDSSALPKLSDPGQSGNAIDRVATDLSRTILPVEGSAASNNTASDWKVNRMGIAASGSTVEMADAATRPMKDEDIIGVIDSQLSYLWSRLRLVAGKPLGSDKWSDRACQTLLGRQATTAEKEVLRSSKESNREAEFVDRLVASDEFAKRWSRLLAEYYLGRRPLVSQARAASELEFVEWLEESLTDRTFVGDWEKSMLEGQIAEDGSKNRVDAASFWLAETIERAMANNRDATDHLVPLLQRKASREEGLIGASRQLMRIAGNSGMVCSQCHADANGSFEMGKMAGATDQPRTDKPFWRVPASLTGLSLSYQKTSRTLKSDSKTDYFVEDRDGRLELIPPGSPTLANGSVATRSVGDFFQISVEPRRALVEMVWSNVFQQPLAPAFGLSDGEGRAERLDLQVFLADRVQSQRSDLGSLLRWIVLSKAFHLEGIETGSAWYLKSTESQIASVQTQRRAFANFPASETLQGESSKLPMDKIAKWIDSKRSFGLSVEAALAQGLSSDPAGNKKPAKQVEYSDDQVRYLISVMEPYSGLSELSVRMAESSMSWPMLLEHAFLASDARFPSRSERDEATKLYESVGKDRARAWILITNGRLGSW